MESGSQQGEIVVVTGASAGVGRALAREFGARRAKDCLRWTGGFLVFLFLIALRLLSDGHKCGRSQAGRAQRRRGNSRWGR